MSDAAGPDAGLGHALRALPQVQPPAGAWAGIEAALARPARPHRALPALALIAVCLVAAAVVLSTRRLPEPVPAGIATGTVAVADSPRALLIRRSANLERLLEALPAERAGRASTGYTAALLEDRIALVDERLSLAPQQPLSEASTEALWQERVTLLDSLMRVRYASSVGRSL